MCQVRLKKKAYVKAVMEGVSAHLEEATPKNAEESEK
jgi:hypothetical protein